MKRCAGDGYRTCIGWTRHPLPCLGPALFVEPPVRDPVAPLQAVLLFESVLALGGAAFAIWNFLPPRLHWAGHASAGVALVLLNVLVNRVEVAW